MRRVRKLSTPRLDLLSVMNLVTLLIPFLLAGAQLVPLAVVDTTLPAGNPGCFGEPRPSLVVDGTGFTLLGGPGGAVHLPCLEATCGAPGTYDLRGLTARLAEQKDLRVEGDILVVVVDDAVPYELVLQTLDAAREDPADVDAHGRARPLFPYPVLAAGAD